MIDKFLQEVANWFMTIKAPQLKDKVINGINILESGQPLEGNLKKLFGFMLFSYSMNHGPASFIAIELLVEEISVSDEFKYYAKDWIDYNKTKNIPQA